MTERDTGASWVAPTDDQRPIAGAKLLRLVRTANDVAVTSLDTGTVWDGPHMSAACDLSATPSPHVEDNCGVYGYQSIADAWRKTRIDVPEVVVEELTNHHLRVVSVTSMVLATVTGGVRGVVVHNSAWRAAAVDVVGLADIRGAGSMPLSEAIACRKTMIVASQVVRGDATEYRRLSSETLRTATIDNLDDFNDSSIHLLSNKWRRRVLPERELASELTKTGQIVTKARAEAQNNPNPAYAPPKFRRPLEPLDDTGVDVLSFDATKPGDSVATIYASADNKHWAVTGSSTRAVDVVVKALLGRMRAVPTGIHWDDVRSTSVNNELYAAGLQLARLSFTAPRGSSAKWYYVNPGVPFVVLS